MQIRESSHHQFKGFLDLCYTHSAQSVAEHETADRQFLQGAYHGKHIIKGVRHTAGPVFQIQIDLQPGSRSPFHFTADIRQMAFGCFFQLDLAVSPGAFAQEIDNFAAVVSDPFDGAPAVNKSQHLDPFRIIMAVAPVDDFPDAFGFSFGNSGRTCFDTVHLETAEHSGDIQFFLGGESNSRGLLSVTQGGIEDFYVEFRIFHRRNKAFFQLAAAVFRLAILLRATALVSRSPSMILILRIFS